VGDANQPPVADFIWNPSNPKIGKTITFDASLSYDPDGSIVKYEWDFENDGINDASGKIVHYSYIESGHHVVKLTVKDNKGVTNCISKGVTIMGSDEDKIWHTADIGDTGKYEKHDISPNKQRICGYNTEKMEAYAFALYNASPVLIPAQEYGCWAKVGKKYQMPTFSGGSHKAKITIVGSYNGQLFSSSNLAEVYITLYLVVEEYNGPIMVKKQILQEKAEGSAFWYDFKTPKGNFSKSVNVTLEEGKTYIFSIMIDIHLKCRGLTLNGPWGGFGEARGVGWADFHPNYYNNESKRDYIKYDKIILNWLS